MTTQTEVALILKAKDLASADIRKFNDQLKKTFVSVGESTSFADKGLKHVQDRLRELGVSTQRAIAPAFKGELDALKVKAKELGLAIQDVEAPVSGLSRALAGLGAAFSVGAVLSGVRSIVAATAALETGLIGVQKTTNLSNEALAELAKSLNQISLDVKVPRQELLAIAQAAGQLGVQGNVEITKFTKTVAQLGLASNLAGEEAATALARILNVTNESIGSVDKLGSVIVALGNSFAATEREIARHTNEIARATAVFDVSSSQAAAFGTVVAALGARAELGASAIGRTFREIDRITREAGPQLEILNFIVGETGDTFRRVFEEDASRAFTIFLRGLNRLASQGQSVSGALEAIGLSGDEINKSLPVLATRVDEIDRAFRLANKEFANATALQTEAAKAGESFSATLQQTKNEADILATNIGERLNPVLKGFAESLSNIFRIANSEKSRPDEGGLFGGLIEALGLNDPPPDFSERMAKREAERTAGIKAFLESEVEAEAEFRAAQQRLVDRIEGMRELRAMFPLQALVFDLRQQAEAIQKAADSVATGGPSGESPIAAIVERQKKDAEAIKEQIKRQKDAAKEIVRSFEQAEQDRVNAAKRARDQILAFTQQEAEARLSRTPGGLRELERSRLLGARGLLNAGTIQLDEFNAFAAALGRTTNEQIDKIQDTALAKFKKLAADQKKETEKLAKEQAAYVAELNQNLQNIIDEQSAQVSNLRINIGGQTAIDELTRQARAFEAEQVTLAALVTGNWEQAGESIAHNWELTQREIEAINRELLESTGTLAQGIQFELERMLESFTAFNIGRDLAQGFVSSFEQSFNVFDNTARSFEDRMKEFAENMISEIGRIIARLVALIAVQTISQAFTAGSQGGLGGAISTVLGGLSGGKGAAKGGIFTRPTFTAIAEREPEIVVPLSRLRDAHNSPGASPLPSGMGGQPVVQEIYNDYRTINIDATDPESFKRQLARDQDFLNAITAKGAKANGGLRNAIKQVGRT